jgi:2-keto-3-deoxy-L-rhamnonate aldolase RhmA
MSNNEIRRAEGTWESSVKKLLREGKPAIGPTITVNSVDAAAHAANLGFDFLWIEMEHSPITLETLRNMVLATRGLKAIPFARVPINELWTAKRVLDAGVLGVIFPFTRTPELARQAAAACRYPPAGRRGSGAGLASLRWPAEESYYDFADRNVLVIVIIEELEGLENIDAIAATPGVDVIFIGASDLSFSLGLRGQQDRPKLQESIAKITAAAKKHNKILGRASGNPEQIKQFIEEGFLFFQANTELGLMAAGARRLLDPLGKFGLESKTSALY